MWIAVDEILGLVADVADDTPWSEARQVLAERLAARERTADAVRLHNPDLTRPGFDAPHPVQT